MFSRYLRNAYIRSTRLDVVFNRIFHFEKSVCITRGAYVVGTEKREKKTIRQTGFDIVAGWVPESSERSDGGGSVIGWGEGGRMAVSTFIRTTGSQCFIFRLERFSDDTNAVGVEIFRGIVRSIGGKIKIVYVYTLAAVATRKRILFIPLHRMTAVSEWNATVWFTAASRRAKRSRTSPREIEY